MFHVLVLLTVFEGIGASIDSRFIATWNNFTLDPQLTHATYGITILDNASGNIIFSHNQDIGLSPASTMKTVTGAAAFHYLGADYRYTTTLQYSGSINATGFLDGYIYFVGTSFALDR